MRADTSMLLKFSGLFLNGTMFPKEHLNHFRRLADEDGELNIEDSVKESWYTFVMEFCKSVNSQWHKTLRNLDKNHKVQVKSILSASDEALVMWIIECKYDMVKERVAKNDIRSKALPSVEGKKKSSKKNTKPKGATDSVEKLNRYTAIFNRIKDCRRNKVSSRKWEDMFWEKFNANYKEDEVDEVSSATNSTKKANVPSLPAYDDQDDEATFNGSPEKHRSRNHNNNNNNGSPSCLATGEGNDDKDSDSSSDSNSNPVFDTRSVTFRNTDISGKRLMPLSKRGTLRRNSPLEEDESNTESEQDDDDDDEESN